MWVTAGLLIFWCASGAAAQTPNRYVLENEKLRVEIDASNGAITRLSDKQGQIDLAAADRPGRQLPPAAVRCGEKAEDDLGPEAESSRWFPSPAAAWS